MTERTEDAVRSWGSTSLRVLHVINQLGPGGAERSLGDLVAPLAREGVQVAIACVNPIAPEYRRDFVPTCSVRSLAGRTLLGKALELRRLLREDPPDLIHTTLFEANLVGRLGAAGLRIPVVSSLVNTEYEPIRRQDPNVGAVRLAIVKELERWTGLLLTRHFQAISEAVKQSAVRTLGLPPERISVVPRGRDSQRLGPPGTARRRRVRDSLSLPQDAEVVIQVGRQEFQKGHEYLLRAVSILLQRRPNLRVLVAGKRGHTTPQLERLHQELGLGERVRFLGSRADIGDLLAAADLFVFPSLYEGLGGALIEAMALGLPVVASDLPALREVVEERQNAILVPPADPEALSDAIEGLLEDRERAELFGARSREIYLERFTIDKSAEALANLYREIIR